LNKLFYLTPILFASVLLFPKSAKANKELDSVSTKNNGLGYSAANIDFDKIYGFSESEFQGQLHLLDANVIFVLQKLRSKIGRIQVSPAYGAIARTDGSKTTMHYANLKDNVLSLAIDIMPIDADLKTAYKAAKEIKEIGAVGVYPDWKPRAGLHIDLRDRKANSSIAEWSGLATAQGQIYRSVNEGFA